MRPSPQVDFKNIYFCLADHYEPYFGNADQEVAHELVDEWVDSYYKVACKHSDSDGNQPKHSYFYPIEEYDEYVLDKIKKICSDGLGDVEIHLHHDNDTAENLENTLLDFNLMLSDKHNLLRRNGKNEITYGFIHGNWALANSRPDKKWCGVDNEIEILLKTACAFDMTMPSAPSDTQTTTINSIYFAKEKGGCKSHDRGEVVSNNNWNEHDLLMIQGPLMLNWKKRNFGVLPKIESGELSADSPPDEIRMDLWERANIIVEGHPEHVFIKLYTHGLQRKNMKMFFHDGGFDKLWSMLEDKYKDKPGYRLHYVTAWEMYNKIKQLARSS